MEHWELEQEAAAAGYTAVCGVDEAGAGPLAGPVYAAAVILPFGLELPYLNDSKQVTPKRRDRLFDLIREQAVAWSIASVSAEEIDEIDNPQRQNEGHAAGHRRPYAGGRLCPHRRQPGPRQPLRYHNGP